MNFILDYPCLILVLSLVMLWLSEWIGASCRKRWPQREEDRDDFSLIAAATLTLLGLIIGFSFSMAINRYDQRKNYEEAEANAIGTEYVRADLLPGANAVKVQELLRKYTDLRVRFYTTRDDSRLAKAYADTAQLQNELWSKVQGVAANQPTPVV